MARKQKNANNNQASAAAANPSTTAVTRSVGTSTSTYANYRDVHTRSEHLETENRALEALVEAELERSAGLRERLQKSSESLSAAIIQGMFDRAQLNRLEAELARLSSEHQVALADRDTVIEALQNVIEGDAAAGAPAQ